MTTTVPPLTLPWVCDDGGRAAAGFKGTTGDCVTRAIAIATGRPYREVYEMVDAIGWEYGKPSSARRGPPPHASMDLMDELGWRWESLRGKQAHLSHGELPDAPRMIADMQRHWCAVIDGVVHDTTDCTRRAASRAVVYGVYVPAGEHVAPAVVSRPASSTTYLDAAVTLWGDAGAYVHDSYTRWRHLFPELPDTLPIVIGITAYGRCIDQTRGDWEHGPRLTIASNLFGRGRLAVDDTMVHEMTHAWLFVTGQNTDHKSEAWYAAIRRLSPAVLGHELDVKRGAQRKSVRVKLDDGRSVVRKVTNADAVPHGDVARWPQAFRPADYHDGAPLACPSY